MKKIVDRKGLTKIILLFFKTCRLSSSKKSVTWKEARLSERMDSMEQCTLKNVNNYLNPNIYSYLRDIWWSKF
jgi:hypothetical protein